MRSPAHAWRLFGAVLFFCAEVFAAVSAAPGPAPGVASQAARPGVLHTCAADIETPALPLMGDAVRTHALSPDGRALYVATRGGELLRYDVDGLRLTARVPLGFEASILATSSGPGALVLAAGRGSAALSVHDPESLATARRYALPEDSTVTSAHDNPGRSRFVLAFGDRDELWEIAYAPDAPPVLMGLVHDYRGNEAVPLPGRLTPRPFRVASPTRSLQLGAVAREVLRVDRDGRIGVVDLEVRREIERPAMATQAAGPVPEAGQELAAAWQRGAARGWLIGIEGASRIDRLRAGHWKLEKVAALPGALLAMAATNGSDHVYALHELPASVSSAPAGPDGARHTGDRAVGLSRVDPLDGTLTAIPVAATSSLPLRLVTADGARCVLLLDAAGRRLLSLPDRPGTPAGNATAPPTR